MAEVTLTPEDREKLAALDWDAIQQSHGLSMETIPVSDLKALANGRATNLITVSIERTPIPGIPFTPGRDEKSVQLVTRFVKNEQSNQWELDPRIVVRGMDKDYKLSPDNLSIVFDFGYKKALDPVEHKKIIDYVLETATFTNAQGEKSKSYVCNICPEPLVMVWEGTGEEQKFFVGLDNRSLRPVAVSEKALMARLVDEEGHSRVKHELFGKGITVTDELAAALAKGEVCAAFGQTQDGKQFATAISYNVARGEITEDRSSRGETVRKAAYEYLRSQQGQAQGQNKSKDKSQKTGKNQGHKLV